MKKLQTWSFFIGLVLALLNFAVPAIIAITVFTTSLYCERFILDPQGKLNMALILTDEQKVTLSVSPRTAAGNPASLDGAPVWSVSDEAVLELTVSEDGLSATVAAKGLGSAQVSVVADADLDEGETRELTGVLDIVVIAAEAAELGISAGVPELK